MKTSNSKTGNNIAVTPLGRLIARMALDGKTHRDFLDDPAAVIAAAGLSPAEEQALGSGDWPAIKTGLGPGAPAPLPPDPPQRHALVIGINRYPYVRAANLRGACNDARMIHDVLARRFDFPAANLLLLLNEQATQAGIRAAFDQILGRIGNNDLVTFFYSGHGSRMKLPEAAFQSIVPHDSGRGEHPNRDIADEELDRWIQRLNRKTPHVTLIFDCCFSGTMTRDPSAAAPRQIEADSRPPEQMFEDGLIPEILRPSPRDPEQLASEAEDRRAEPGGLAGYVRGRHRAVVVAACREDELANECWAGRQAYGILSFGLAWWLQRAVEHTNWRDMFEKMVPWVTAKYRFQHPQVEGNWDQELFGTREIRPAPYLKVLRVAAGKVELEGGVAHGVTAGSEWSIHPRGALDTAADELARVEITTVAAISSWARILSAGDRSRLKAGQRAFLRVERVAAPGLAVRLEVEGEHGAPLAGLIEASPLLGAADGGDEQPTDVLVRWLEPRTEVAAGAPCPNLGPLPQRTMAAVGLDGRLAVRTRPAVGSPGGKQPDRETRGLAGDLESVARYQRLLAIESSDLSSRLGDEVRLVVLRRGADGQTFVEAEPESGDGLLVFDEGQGYDLEIRNGHAARIWITLLLFESNKSISRFVPLRRHPAFRPGGHALEAGETLRVSKYYSQDPRYRHTREFLATVPRGFPWAAEPGESPRLALDYLKLMVTPVAADFEFVEQDPVLGPPLVRDPGPQSHPLLQLARLYACGKGSRSLTVRPAGQPSLDWATITRPIGIRLRR